MKKKYQDKIKDLIQTTIQKDKNIGFLKDNLFYIPIIHSPAKFFIFLIFITIIAAIAVPSLMEINNSHFYIIIIIFLSSINLIIYIDVTFNYDYLIFDLDNLILYESSYFLNIFKYRESKKMPSQTINNIKIEVKAIRSGRLGFFHYYDYVKFVTKDDEVFIDKVEYSLNNRNLLTKRYRLLANILGIKLNFIGDIDKLQKEKIAETTIIFLILIIIGHILLLLLVTLGTFR